MKALLGFLFIGSLLLGSSSFAEDANGVLMVVKGDIKVTSGKDAKTEAARIGRKVFAGDTITAGPDSRAKIVMSDKNILNISPDSKMKIEQYTNDPKSNTRSVELKVEYGKVRASVEQKYDGEKNKFNIKTPTAVAGVRGTDFLTSFNKSSKQSSIVTFSGTVAVGSPGPKGQIMNPVFVRPGQATNVGASGMPEAPHAMPKDELNKMNKESSADTSKGSSKDSSSSNSGQSDKKDKDKDKDSKDSDSSGAKKDSAAKSDDSGKSDSSKSDSKSDAKSDSSAKQDSGSKDSAKNSDSGSGSASRSPASDSSGSSSSSGSGSSSGSASTSSSAGSATSSSTNAAPPPAAAPPPMAAPMAAMPVMPAPSMVSSADLGPAASANIQVNSGPAPVRAPAFVAPSVPVAPPTTANPFIGNATGAVNSKVRATITITRP